MNRKPSKQPDYEAFRVAMFEKIKSLGAVRAVVNYSGGGDDGQCEEGVLLDGDNNQISVPEGVTVTWYSDGGVHTEWAPGGTIIRYGGELVEMSIPKALMLYCYDVLEQHFPGDWVNNEGGYGVLEIQLDHPYKVTLEAHARVETTDDYEIDVETGEVLSERLSGAG